MVIALEEFTDGTRLRRGSWKPFPFYIAECAPALAGAPSLLAASVEAWVR